MMNTLLNIYTGTLSALNSLGSFIPQLGIRLLLAYEFGVSGLQKLEGDNWFRGIYLDFPYPFNTLPADFSWLFVAWTEVIAAGCLLLGLVTRVGAIALLLVDIVAWMSVHADNGYNVCANGFKLPLIYMVLLLPLILTGAGKASIDYAIARRFSSSH